MADDAPEPAHAGEGYVHHDVADLSTNPEKPGDRWELSPAFGVDAYNFNVADVPPGSRLSRNEYHRHPNQREFFYVVAGRLRVEAPDDSFDLGVHEAVRFDAGVAHLLHNPFDEVARVVAVGDPPEGRRPVERIEGGDELLAERGNEE